MKITEDDKRKILKHAEDHFKDLEDSKTTWNGRQFRHAFKTAIVLAKYDAHQAQIEYELQESPKPALKVGQLKKVAEASKHFDYYLRETLDASAMELAFEEHKRRDDMGEE